MLIQHTVSKFCYDTDKEWQRIMMTMVMMNIVMMMMMIRMIILLSFYSILSSIFHTIS